MPFSVAITAVLAAALALPAAVPTPQPASGAASAPGRERSAPVREHSEPAEVAAELDRVLADRRLAGATVVGEVREEGSGVIVWARDPDRRVLPASNQKLLTAAAALEILGPEYRFRTEVRNTGTIGAGTLRGDLFLVGRGDPTMTYARYDTLATAVAKSGVTRITGRLVADDSWFDGVPLGLDWSWQDEPFADTAPISALTFAANDRLDNAAVEVRYRPGAAGKPPVLTLHPPTTTVRLVNRAVSGRTGAVAVTRDHGAGTIVVSGTVTSAGTELVSVPDPAATSADVFRAALRRHGVELVRRTERGSAPATAVTVIAQVSDPLARVLPTFLKLSNNGIAELLVKAMSRAAAPGVPGSWPGGLTAMSTALAGLGADPAALTLGDGSGLSRRNWVTARQLTTVLVAARERTWFPAWYAALPIAADPDPSVGGTLRDRMRNTAAAGNVHAKTGTLTGVNALSGYVTAGDGRRLVFSVIANNAVAGVSDLLDRIPITLAGIQRSESGRYDRYRSGGDRANARPAIPQPRHPGPATAAAAGRSDRAGSPDQARRAPGADAAHLVRGVVEPARELHAGAHRAAADRPGDRPDGADALDDPPGHR
ncbi:D-alanyl-D-alanine carboxypeptidase/D-alanyl-D-alanine-endopeptidase [Actinoplanes sp. GCM10030250]|uniref:D-alanyl-D-alanine carboxypeptidase/D-alanyl-D-alanine endopeptidase n=1 Tax=Actinoplanes sp. GCM10030250 TaxID=3273376 RepID=UPI00362301B5